MQLNYYINDKRVSRFKFKRSLRVSHHSSKMIKHIISYLYISKNYYKDDNKIYTVSN